MRAPLRLACLALSTLSTLWVSTAWAQPYPNSSAITGIRFDRSSHDRQAPGSDNWPVTWADDGHQYTSFGDGGGFRGTNGQGRVSLGVARVEGSSTPASGFNVWGGASTETPASFGGKSYGILSVAGVLYMWVSPGSGADNYTRATLYRSSNKGRTWQPASWSFTSADDRVLPTFLQFGRDYAGARDDYVYAYSIRLEDNSDLAVQRPGVIDLMRVPRGQIMQKSAWRFFGGLDGENKATWVSSASQRRPVFEDSQGVGWNMSVSYNPGLGRYLLATEHVATGEGRLGIFDAPKPWGPWTTVLYSGGNWEGFSQSFFWNFSNKWLSADGRDFTLVFSGFGNSDSWNTIRGRFEAAGVRPPEDVGCSPAPLESCVAASKAKLSIDERNSGRASIKLSLQDFAEPTSRADLGDPLDGNSSYDLCIYGGKGELAAGFTVDDGDGGCGVGRSCWKEKGSRRIAYKDPLGSADGVTAVDLKAGPVGKGKASWKAADNRKRERGLPLGTAAALQGASSSRAQIVSSDGACFEASLTVVRKSGSKRFKAKSD